MNNDSLNVLVGDEGAVRTITLNRPDVLNACNEALLTELSEAVREAEQVRSVRCIVLSASGRAFCSGQDLGEVTDRQESDTPLELGKRLRDLYNPIIIRLARMEKPVIASVHGSCAGAGVGLALACDFRIAAESAVFIQAFVRVGLVPDCGCTFFLPRIVGAARTAELAMTGRKVEAAEAEQLGLVNRVVPDDSLASETAGFAAKLGEAPTQAVGLIKRALAASWTHDLETQLDYEATLQTTAQKTSDHHEGVTAFLEKRKAVFEGC